MVISVVFYAADKANKVKNEEKNQLGEKDEARPRNLILNLSLQTIGFAYDTVTHMSSKPI